MAWSGIKLDQMRCASGLLPFASNTLAVQTQSKQQCALPVVPDNHGLKLGLLRHSTCTVVNQTGLTCVIAYLHF